jgi:hypothetical protein
MNDREVDDETARIGTATIRVIQFNSVQFFIIYYVPSQQPQGQLQTQHSVDKTMIIVRSKSV